MLENLAEEIVEAKLNAVKLNEAIDSLTEGTYLVETAEASLAQQVKDYEGTVTNLEEINTKLMNNYSLISNFINFRLLPDYQQTLEETRQAYLEDETDTARESAELMELYLSNPGDIRLLAPVLNWIKNQVPPTVEETEYIDFETARINDPNLDEGEELIEVEGAKGEYKVTYEINQIDGVDERTELARELMKAPVTQVIRVGTKSLEEEE